MSTPVRSRFLRLLAVIGFAAVASAAIDDRLPTKAIPGMTFRLAVTLRNTTSSGRTSRALTLQGHGSFAGGHGRVDIDSVSPGPFRKGDFFLILDTLNSLWARPSDLRVRRMNAPLVTPAAPQMSSTVVAA